MIAILVVAHKEISNNYIACVKHINGKTANNLFSFSVEKNVEPDLLRQELKQHIDKLMQFYTGVLILTDLFGATPSNIAVSLCVPGEVEVLSGLNMAMLLRALHYSTYALSECLDKAYSGAHAGIIKVDNQEEGYW